MPTASGHTSAISARKVIGASVKDMDGDKIGAVEDIVLDKQTNNIMFAVVGFGGLVGMGEKYHPLPWSSLTYDEDANAYRVAFTKEELRSAPADTINELTAGDGVLYRDIAHQHYNAEPYWR